MIKDGFPTGLEGEGGLAVAIVCVLIGSLVISFPLVGLENVFHTAMTMANWITTTAGIIVRTAPLTLPAASISVRRAANWLTVRARHR